MPPTHVRLPQSLFGFGGVLRESEAAQWQNQREGDKDGGTLLAHHRDRKKRG